MDRFNFYFRQKVTEQELDNAFDAVESGIQNFVSAFGYIGITNEAEVAQQATPNFTVQVSAPAVVYDKQSRHIAWPTVQNVDCALDENGASTAVIGAANSKWLSLFAHYTRTLTDPRTDGFGDTVYYNEAESYELRLVQGAEAVTPSRPPLDGTDILLADILIAFGQSTITTGDLDFTRTEYAYDLSGSPTEIRERNLQDVLQTMLDSINGTTGDFADQTAPDDGATLVGIDAISGSHLSTIQGTLKAMLADMVGKLNDDVGSDCGTSHIGQREWDGGGTHGFDIPTATTARNAIEALITNLNDDTAGPDAATRIGAAARSGSPYSLAQGSVGSQLTALLGFLNGGIFTYAYQDRTTPTDGVSQFNAFTDDTQYTRPASGGYVEMACTAGETVLVLGRVEIYGDANITHLFRLAGVQDYTGSQTTVAPIPGCQIHAQFAESVDDKDYDGWSMIGVLPITDTGTLRVVMEAKPGAPGDQTRVADWAFFLLKI